MADIARLGIRVDSSGLVKAQKETEKLTSRGKAAENAFGGLKTVVGAVFTGTVVRQAIKYSDTITQINSRLGIVIKSHEELVSVQEELFAISQKNRVGYQETADLFFRIRRSFDETEVSTQKIIVATEALGRAIAISGGSAESANAAIIQLGQAFASGELRGEELRSVMEQTPRVAKALADALKTTVGGLRDMAEVGELTSDVVLKGLIDQADDLGREFKSITPTIESAMTTLSNSVMKAAGDMSAATGAGEGLAETIMGLSSAMDDFVASNDKFVKQGLPFAFEQMTQLVPGIGFLKDAAKLLREINEQGDQSGIRFKVPQRPSRGGQQSGDKFRRTAKTGAAAIDPDLITRINAIKESLKTEEQLETESYTKRVLSLISAEEMKLLSTQEANALIEQEQARHQTRLTEIDKEEIDMRNKFLTESQAGTIDAVGSIFGNLATLMSQGGKDAFEAYKVFAIAQAGVSGAMAVIQALAAPAPPPIPQILAATTGALVATQMAMISQQSYSGRALGGQVSSGTSYLVGERGPELLTMGNNSGNITPNNKMGVGQEIKVTNVFQMSPGLSGTVQAEVMRMAPLIAVQAQKGVESAMYQGGSMSRAVGRRR